MMTSHPETSRLNQRWRKLLPRSKMGIFGLVLLLLWLLRICADQGPWYRTLSGFGLVLDFIPLLLCIPAAYYLWKMFLYARTRILWKISRRLVLAHIFIGAIPVIIIIGIFYFSAILFYYQLSYFLIFNQIGIHAARVHALNQSIRDGMQQIIVESDAASPAALRKALDTDVRFLLGSYPSASIILSYTDPVSHQTVTYANRNSISQRMEGYIVPLWLQGTDFSGLVIEDARSGPESSRLLLRSYVPGVFPSDFPYSLELTVPLDGYLLGRIKAALGQDMLLARQSEHSGMNVILPLADIAPQDIVESTFPSEDAQSLPGWMWPIPLFPTSWSSGEERQPEYADALMIEVSLPKLLHNLFRSENVVGKLIYDLLAIIIIIFLLAEAATVVIGILLTRSITNAVHSLDRGTHFVKKGDFSHRIVVRSQDQLGSLAASFNQMTEYVQHLLKESVQKERLEREIEIAREVQERLFPDQAPTMKHLEVAGVCLPARMVSGDYYDFLRLGDSALGLAVGDICGKGISAALLMANLQATLRSNVLNLWSQTGQSGAPSVALIVEKLNSQIYSYTTDNKFATFFYGLYDDAHQTLTYCNAGHNPPLFFNGDGVRRLETGGTVVGIFEDSRYEQETIHLTPGTLFVAYTDGIVETVNEYGEEFGEQRLIQLVQDHRHLPPEELKERIIETVLAWKFASEQEDDMTVIIAKTPAG